MSPGFLEAVLLVDFLILVMAIFPTVKTFFHMAQA